MLGFARPACLPFVFVIGLTFPQAVTELADLISTANEQISAGDYGGASATVSRVLTTGLSALGTTHLELIEYEEAKRAFLEAAEIAADDPTVLRNLAILYLRTGDYESGIRAAQALVDGQPEDVAETHELLGKLHYLAEDYPSAAEHLSRAYAEDSSDLSIAYTLGLAYLNQKELERADRLFSALVQRLGGSAQLHVLLGRAYRETADSMDATYTVFLDHAIREFQTAIEINPGQPRSHYYLALTYLKQEGITWAEKAIEEMKTELEVNPDHFFSHYYLGLLLCQNRQYEEALVYLRRCKQLNPNYFDTDMLMARATFWLGRYQEAVDILEGLLDRSTGDERALYQEGNIHYLLGRALVRLGRKEEAREHLLRSEALKREWAANEQRFLDRPGTNIDFSRISVEDQEETVTRMILSDAPPDPERRSELEKASRFYSETVAAGYQLAARTAAARNEFGETARFLALASGWKEPTAETLYNLGVAHFKSGQLSDAADALEASLERDASRPDTTQLMVQVALALLEAGERQRALDGVNVLLRYNSNVADLYYLRARIHFQESSWQSVADDLEQAVRLNPEFAEAYYQLANAYAKLQRTEDSQRALERYQSLKKP